MSSPRRILPLRRPALRTGVRDTLVWVVPVLVICVIYFSPRHVLSAQTAITGLLAFGLLVLAAKRPDRSLLALIVFLPFQGLILARLWGWGLPASVVSHLGAWKDALALGVIVAGARSFIASGRRADGLDRIALAFVALVALYALLQPEIVPGSPSASNIRLLGFRETAGFVLLLLGARHAPLGPRFTERALRVLLLVAGIVAAIGVYEAIDSSGWNHFIVHTIKYPAYQIAVLHGQPFNPTDIRTYGYIGGARVARIGSVFLNDLNLAFYLVLPFAVGVERALRRTASPLVVLTTITIGAALLLTQTRSAILGAAVVLVLALVPTAGRPRHWRTQAVIVLAGLAMIAVPAAFSTGVAKRFSQANNRSDQSTAGHVTGFWSGLHTIGQHPLGQGLGTGAGIGQRFTVANDKVAENSYLDVGDEVGILPMLLFAALTVALVLKLRRVARERPEPALTAAFAGGAGLAVSAWFLHTWLDFAVAWTYWGIAGAALGLAFSPATASDRATEAAPAEPESAAYRALPGVAASASR
jgi:hypothetical protein